MYNVHYEHFNLNLLLNSLKLDVELFFKMYMSVLMPEKRYENAWDYDILNISYLLSCQSMLC